MITGKIKSQIDQIWNAFWSGGAIVHFEAAVRADPAYASARYHLGRILADAGRLPEAQSHLEAYLRLRPQAPERAFVEAFIATLKQRTLVPSPR